MNIVCERCGRYYAFFNGGCWGCYERDALDKILRKSTISEPTLPDRL